MTPSVEQTELISRFLTHKDNEFSLTKNCVKPGAFRPPPNLRFSVFRLTDAAKGGVISDLEVWRLAKEYVENARGPVVARADIVAQAVFATGLQIDPDGNPHPRHANVIGWPEKEKQLEIRQALAKAAQLVLRN